MSKTICGICGVEFNDFESNARKYCSRKCYGLSKVGTKASEETRAKMRGRTPWNKRVNMICRDCGCELDLTPVQLKNNGYACIPCRHKYERDWRRKRRLAGHTRKCEPISAEHRRKYQKVLRKREPLKHRAHLQVQRAVSTGQLIRPQICQSCKEEGAIDGHHPDYSKPLDVLWLCRTCHAEAHYQEKKARE